MNPDKSIKILTIKEVEMQWNTMSKLYIAFESSPQTFFFTLVNMLKLQEAKHILEVACGGGLLLPYAMQRKNPEGHYYATDISEEMIKESKKKIEKTLEFFSSSISMEDWCLKNKLSFKHANGQQNMGFQHKFDRIICNLVLMLTEDPDKMLKSLYDQSENGCLIGITVWGDKSLNNFHNHVAEVVQQMGIQSPKTRSNHHLYNIIQKKMEDVGWSVLVTWQQNSPLPFFQVSASMHYINYTIEKMKISEEQKDEVRKRVQHRLSQILKSKNVFNFPVQMVIGQKIVKI